MAFKKYQHVERLGTDEVDGIVSLVEPCLVFPKLDGTNGSIWKEGEEICFGSRNRQLSLDNDNQNFMNEMHTRQDLIDFFTEFPTLRLYGEWLVPHTLKTYQDTAWKEFYVFDVMDGEDYVPYDVYKEMLDKYSVEYVPPLAVVERGTDEQFSEIAERNAYLMKDGEIGEGIVIKRYGYKNKYGRTVWAKLVRNEFKTKHVKTMGPTLFKATKMVEEEICKQFVTKPLVDKVHAKIVNEMGRWESNLIPRLLHTVYYDLIREDSWNFIKVNKNPTIDFNKLQKMAYEYVKMLRPDLF